MSFACLLTPLLPLEKNRMPPVLTKKSVNLKKKMSHFEGEKYQITREYSKKVNKKVNEESCKHCWSLLPLFVPDISASI